jgi:REP-associated tyrosine transposase
MPRNLLGDHGVFHVYGRGTARSAIFLDADDYDLFWPLLANAGKRFLWTWHAACLMPNHYHLILEARLEDLSRGMHRVNGCYAQSFNARYRRVGHLFQSRFGARLIESDEYLERASLYVAGNAARAELCETPHAWPWASLGNSLTQHSARFD